MFTPSRIRLAALSGVMLLTLTAAPPSVAQEVRGGQRRFNIADLDWLGGSWKGTLSGGEVNQTWMPPAGRTLLGMNRVINNRRTVLRQFFLIEQSGEGITLSMRAVNERGDDSPDGTSLLRLVTLRGSESVFETPGQVTKRLSYRIDPDGSLFCRLETFRTPGGAPERVQFRMQRVTDR